MGHTLMHGTKFILCQTDIQSPRVLSSGWVTVLTGFPKSRMFREPVLKAYKYMMLVITVRMIQIILIILMNYQYQERIFFEGLQDANTEVMAFYTLLSSDPHNNPNR